MLASAGFLNKLRKSVQPYLLESIDTSHVVGLRDRGLIALMIYTFARVGAVVRLRVEDYFPQKKRWWVRLSEKNSYSQWLMYIPASCKGGILLFFSVSDFVKGRRRRTVPLPSWLKRWIDEWMTGAALSDGCVFRALNKSGRIWGTGLSANVVWSLVQAYAGEIGVPNLAPHDLRRTCAKLCRAAGGDLEQIQMLLGHASIQTTERYLGTRQNLVEAVNDQLLLHTPPAG